MEIKKSWNERVWQIDTTSRGDRELTEEESELREIFDSKKDLDPVRCLMYREQDGDILFHFFSRDKQDENQSFELIINKETYAIVKFRSVPKVERKSNQEQNFFTSARIDRYAMKEAIENTKKSDLIFRLKRLEEEQK